MNHRVIVPMLDLLLITVGGLAMMISRMSEIETLPIEVSQVSGGASGVVDTTRRLYVGVTEEGLSVAGSPVTEAELVQAARDRDVVLSVDRALPTERTMSCVALLAEVCSRVAMEVTRKVPAGDGEDR